MNPILLKILKESQKHQAKSLDLSNCGLTSIPKQIGDLVWVEELIIGEGSFYDYESAKERKTSNEGGRNEFHKGDNNNNYAFPDLKGLLSRKKTVNGITDETKVFRLPSLLSNLPQLQKIVICGGRHGRLSIDITALTQIPKLKSLYILNYRIHDLSILSQLTKLQILVLNRNKITDLGCLAPLTNLRLLSLGRREWLDDPLKVFIEMLGSESETNFVSDVSPLSKNEAIEVLFLDDNNISDLSLFLGFKNLIRLDIIGNQVRDLTPLSNLKNLIRLDIENNRVSDLSPISILNKLVYLSIKKNYVKSLVPLTDVTSLKYLDISDNPIKNLAPLAKLENLQTFKCTNCQIVKLKPLTKLRSLKYFDCFGCPIQDCPETIYKTHSPEKLTTFFKEQQRSTSTRKSKSQKTKREMMNSNLYPHGYALFVGIRYGHTLSRLDGTLRDVRDLSHHFIDIHKAGYLPQNVIVLKEQEATKVGIYDALAALKVKANNDTESTVIIYYSGHGGRDRDRSFLLPYDYDKGNLIDSKDFAKLIDGIVAKKTLIILDCCHSENIAVDKNVTISAKFLEGFLDDVNPIFDNSATEKKAGQFINKGGGRVILTSCQANETSLDVGSNGLFTQVLLECLTGTNNIESDGWVRLIDMMRYIPSKVAEKAAAQGHNQHPMFKRIENLTSEQYIICAYDLAKTKQVGSPREEPKVQVIDVDNLISLINSNDFSKFFVQLAKLPLEDKFSFEKDRYSEEYRSGFSRGIDRLDFADRLKLFVHSIRLKSN